MNMLTRFARLGFRIPLSVSFLLLSGSGISFALDKQELADSLAFYSFYFLAGAAAFMIINNIRETILNKRHEDKDTINSRE